MKMSQWQRIILGFCIFLLAVFIFVSPLVAKDKDLGSRFGIGAFVLNRYQDNELDKAISSIKKLDATWSREEFVWSELEPIRGEWRWEIYDEKVKKLNKAGINILGLLDYSAPWATEDAKRMDSDKYPPNIVAWENYIRQVAKHYDGQVTYWEIWNEPNSPVFFRPAPDAQKYFELLSVAYKTIKDINPSAKIVLGGIAGVDTTYLDQLLIFGANKYCDIVAIHPYPNQFRIPPESNGLSENLKEIDIVAQKFAKPIWITEIGWPTDSAIGITEEKQAQFLLNANLLLVSNQNIKKIFWYNLRDDGSDPKNPEDNFGLLRRDYSEKPSFAVLRKMITDY